jgi:hypothetical protein
MFENPTELLGSIERENDRERDLVVQWRRQRYVHVIESQCDRSRLGCSEEKIFCLGTREKNLNLSGLNPYKNSLP